MVKHHDFICHLAIVQYCLGSKGRCNYFGMTCPDNLPVSRVPWQLLQENTGLGFGTPFHGC